MKNKKKIIDVMKRSFKEYRKAFVPGLGTTLRCVWWYYVKDGKSSWLPKGKQWNKKYKAKNK